MNKFVHLRNYSQYSLSKGALKLSDLAKYCYENKFPAVAITDFDNLFGALEFSIECRNLGVQPLIGCNLYLKSEKLENGYVLLICKNQLGYENLLNLVSKSYLENSDQSNPYITLENLIKYNEGLVCLTGGEFGILNKTFQKSKSSLIKSIKFFQKTLKENFFIEIQRTSNFKINEINDSLINLSLEEKIPLVATNENFFLEKKFCEFMTHYCVSPNKNILIVKIE